LGIDTIICTVIGPSQLELLKAAVAVGVRRFAPAEFEGPISCRPETDLLDRGKHNMRGWLEYYQERNKIQFTVFSCGVLYERFAPMGLKKSRVGLRLNYGNEGDFIINPRNLLAAVPHRNERGDISICMTAAHDVARLVVRSLSMTYWPPEFTLVGEKIAVSEIIRTVLRVRSKSSKNCLSKANIGTDCGQVHSNSVMLGETQLQVDLAAAQVTSNEAEQIKILEHLAVVEGRYTFSRPGSLRQSNQDIRPIKFETWLRHQWQDIPVEYD
jgi:hypothetical protein